jgi:hypothetical protein
MQVTLQRHKTMIQRALLLKSVIVRLSADISISHAGQAINRWVVERGRVEDHRLGTSGESRQVTRGACLSIYLP